MRADRVLFLHCEAWFPDPRPRSSAPPSCALWIAGLGNGAGLTMALPAIAARPLELRTIDARSEAMRVANWHLMTMATVWICFLLAFLLPIASETTLDRWTAELGATASAGIGFLLMSVGGWLGGRLVYEFGIGVSGKAKPSN